MVESYHRSRYQWVKAAKDQGEKTRKLYSLSTLDMTLLTLEECSVVQLLPQALLQQSSILKFRIGTQ